MLMVSRSGAAILPLRGEQVAGDAFSAETLGLTLFRRVADLADDPMTPLFFGKLNLEPTDEDHRRVLAVLTFLRS